MSRSPSNPAVAGCRRVPLEDPAMQDNPRMFALLMQDGAMAGDHILAGDVLVFEHGVEPRSGDVVAAFVDGESMVRTYLSQQGTGFLKGADADLIATQELVIQGVMVKLIRERR